MIETRRAAAGVRRGDWRIRELRDQLWLARRERKLFGEAPQWEDVRPGLDETHLVLWSRPDGYRLVERKGPPVRPGDRLVLGGEAYSAFRVGRSPLPGDDRRCVFLEPA